MTKKLLGYVIGFICFAGVCRVCRGDPSLILMAFREHSINLGQLWLPPYIWIDFSNYLKGIEYEIRY